MALTKVSTDGVKDDAVTTDKLANAINTERTANTAKVQTTINNNADNRVITGSGTANTLEGEANLFFNGSQLGINTTPDSGVHLHVQNDGEANMILEGNVNGQGGFLMLKNNSDNANTTMSIQNLDAGGQGTSEITFQNVSNANNEGLMRFSTRPSGGSMTERMRIHSNGAISVGTNDSARSFTLYNPVSNDTIFRIQNNNGNEDTGLEILYVASSVTRTMRMGGYIQADNEDIQIANTEGFRFYTNTGTGTHERFILAKNGAVGAQGIYDQTTSGGANVNVASDGHLRRSTSSRRYKNTITDATHGLTELLKLNSVTFKGNEDGDTVFGGLIAEDVHDAGLTEFVQYDKDNKPDALAYGNMVALCIKAIQELTSKVETLETKVAALEAA